VAEAQPLRIGSASFAVALLGLAISTYLTIEHFTTAATLACPETGMINCAKVTTSSWSHIGSVPVAVLGLSFFAAMSALCSPRAWRFNELDSVRIAGAAVGVAFAIYLIWVELFRLNAICLWCTAVHTCTVLLFAAVLWTTAAAPRRLKGQTRPLR
jgi:uncharacterized membrane protein